MPRPQLAALSLAACTLGCNTSSRPPPSAPPPATVVSVQATPPEPAPESRLDDVDAAEVPAWQPGDPVPERWLHPALATARAPERFHAIFDTTKGPFVVRVERSWAPQGADRFYNLVRIGYYTDIAVFRAIEGFMVQFGIHGVPEVNDAWRAARIPDDPNQQTNRRGTIVFAMAGPGTRATQLFVNTVDNAQLDAMSFSPFGEVVEGMHVVDSLYSGYGEAGPRGRGPNQSEMQRRGNSYIRAEFPEMDFIRSVRLTSR